MRIKKSKLLPLFLCGALLLSGCGNTKATTGMKHNVYMITKSTESNFWKTVYSGANAAATEYNLNLIMEGPESEEDYESQNKMIEAAVENGAQVIVISAVDYEKNAQMVDYAASNGVKIVVIDSDVKSNYVSARIGTDNYEAGVMAAQAALQAQDGPLNIGIVNYDKNSANGQQREQGFRDTVEKDPRVKIVQGINVVSTTEAAMEGTISMLQTYPQINVVVTFNEWTSLGVGWAIRNLDLASQTRVVAFDSNVVSVGMLETGEVDALIVQNPYAMGYLGVEAAYNLINGQTTESEVDTATITVTRENMYDTNCQKMLFSFE